MRPLGPFFGHLGPAVTARSPGSLDPDSHTRARGTRMSSSRLLPPSVSVVITTRDRPELLRQAIDSVISQDYEGVVETVVVFDQTAPDTSLERTDEFHRCESPRTIALPASRADATRA